MTKNKKINITTYYHLFLQFLYRRVVVILSLLIFCGFIVALMGTHQLSLKLVDAQAIHYSKVVVQILDKARVLYSKNVVDQVKNMDSIEVTPDYHGIEGSIPNPATYTIELGENLTEEIKGALFRLYSEYPFPERQKTGGPRDQFELDALYYLKQNPSRSFYRKEIINNQLTFRYTETIRMEASCIHCHNTLINSPKKDWQVGDVRGIIEINQPLDSIMFIANDGLKMIYTTLSIIFAIAIFSLAIVIGKFRSVNQELEKRVIARTQALQILATTDPLTKLANRRQFEHIFVQEWRRACRQQKKLSVILCDIDDFKQYNDTYGHQAGDKCLRQISEVIKNSLQRAGELAARYGGEEFIMVLPNLNQTEAITLAKMIRYRLHQLAIPHQNSSVKSYVTLSLGVATIVPTQNSSPEKFIKIADENLYQAKQEGKDRWFSSSVVSNKL